MAVREFRDGAGRRWMVWEVDPEEHLVRPQRTDRRVAADRRRAPAPDPIVERRRLSERRGRPERRRRARATPFVPEEFRTGWLCFVCDDLSEARRRLAPMPSGWQEASAAELEAALRRARPVGSLLEYLGASSGR